MSVGSNHDDCTIIHHSCKGTIMEKIVTHLWFDDTAEEAMAFYTSIFKNSRIVSVFKGKAPMPDGSIGELVYGIFELEGRTFFALNGGPMFKFTPAISLYVNCDTQEEIDELWNKLLAGGGKPMDCGWLEDKFGLAWQIVPSVLERLTDLSDPDRSMRVMQSLMGMTKIDLVALERAYDGK